MPRDLGLPKGQCGWNLAGREQHHGRFLSMWGRWWYVCVLRTTLATMWIVDGGIEREDGGHAGDRRGEPDQGKGEQFTHLFRR